MPMDKRNKGIYKAFQKIPDNLWFDYQNRAIQTKKQVEAEIQDFFKVALKENPKIRLDDSTAILLATKIRKTLVYAAADKMMELDGKNVEKCPNCKKPLGKHTLDEHVKCSFKYADKVLKNEKK